MANIYDLIQQNAELPTNFINSYNAGVQMKRQEEDRQLQRKQLIQQIEGLIQDNRKRKAEATLKEEELGPEATEARKKGRLAETVKAEADIKYTIPERKAGLEQTYAQTEASKASAASSRSSVRLNQIRAQGENINNQLNQLRLTLEMDPNNIQAKLLANQLAVKKNQLDLQNAEELARLDLEGKAAKIRKDIAETGKTQATADTSNLTVESKRAIIELNKLKAEGQRLENQSKRAKLALENDPTNKAAKELANELELKRNQLAIKNIEEVSKLELESKKLANDLAEVNVTLAKDPTNLKAKKLANELAIKKNQIDILAADERNKLELESERIANQRASVALTQESDPAHAALNQQQRLEAERNIQLMRDPVYQQSWTEAQRGQLVDNVISFRTQEIMQQATGSKLARQLAEDGVAVSTLPVQQRQTIAQAEAAELEAKEFLKQGDVRSAEASAKHMEAAVRAATASGILPQVRARLQIELDKLKADLNKTQIEVRKPTTPSSDIERMVSYVSTYEGKKQSDPTWVPSPEEKSTYDRYSKILTKKETITGRTPDDVRDKTLYRDSVQAYNQNITTLNRVNRVLANVERIHGGAAGTITGTWGNIKDIAGGLWDLASGANSPSELRSITRRDAMLNADPEVIKELNADDTIFRKLTPEQQIGYVRGQYTDLKYAMAKALSPDGKINVDDMRRMDLLLGGVSGGEVNKGALYAIRDIVKDKSGVSYAEAKTQETGVIHKYFPSPGGQSRGGVFKRVGDQWVEDMLYGIEQ